MNLASFNTGNAATSLTASGVPNGTYYIRVRAVNVTGVSAASNEVVAVVGVGGCISPPSTAFWAWVVVQGSIVTLTWSAPIGGCPVTSYILEAGSASALANLANANIGNALTYTATGVGAGVYYVRVRAANAFGASGPSNEVVFTVGTTTPGFTGTTLVTPGISFRSNRSQPPFNISAAQSATVLVNFTAPADCVLFLEDCPADRADLANCVFRRSVLGSAGSANWTASYQPGAYQVVITLQTVPRSANGPVCGLLWHDSFLWDGDTPMMSGDRGQRG